MAAFAVHIVNSIKLYKSSLVFKRSLILLSMLSCCLQFAFDGPPSMPDFYTRSLSLSKATRAGSRYV
jgi:hypothetical protein